MVTYEITCSQECIIDGIGIFAAGETKTVGDQELRQFANVHGYPLSKAQFPSSVTVTAVIGEEE